MPDTDRSITRHALFDLVWSKPMTHVAADFETTGAHVRALCARLNLPVPVQGHWMKLEVGKAAPKPEFPAEPALDDVEHEITRPRSRLPAPATPLVKPVTEKQLKGSSPVEQPSPEPERLAEHKLVRKTRAALADLTQDERRWIGGSGKFRLIVFGSSADRVAAILSSLITSIQRRGWSFSDGKKGLEVSIVGEAIGFEIEERTHSVRHVVTPHEERAIADYQRRKDLALRNRGQWPGAPPSIPTTDYRPTGQLILKLDSGISIEGLRRTFSDGKRQRLKGMIDDIMMSLERWSEGMKKWREDVERHRREAAEAEERRQSAERRARMDGYRLTFVRKQSERLEQVATIDRVLAHWTDLQDEHLSTRGLVEWARDYRARLLEQVSPEAVEGRISRLRLMHEEAYIYEGYID